MNRRYAIALSVLLVCGCSKTSVSTAPGTNGTGGQSDAAEANTNVTLVSLSVPGMM